MKESAYKVGVIGGGAWGTALAILANRAGSRTSLYARNANVIQLIEDHRTNDIYLPGVFIPPEITVSTNPKDVREADLVVIATPTNYVRSTCIAILSGPNFADEAARGLPTATTIACEDKGTWDLLTYAVGGRLFRPYLTDDVIGTQIGGAIKNVIAIASGIAQGRGMGDNASAAIITRGFAEMARLAVARGGKYETLMGLSGLGDLLLTCGSVKSRNMSFGFAVGKGKPVKEVLEARGRGATEGVLAAESVMKIARKYEVQMPICQAVYKVLYEDVTVDDAMKALLERPFSQEGF